MTLWNDEDFHAPADRSYAELVGSIQERLTGSGQLDGALIEDLRLYIVARKLQKLDPGEIDDELIAWGSRLNMSSNSRVPRSQQETMARLRSARKASSMVVRPESTAIQPTAKRCEEWSVRKDASARPPAWLVRFPGFPRILSCSLVQSGFRRPKRSLKQRKVGRSSFTTSSIPYMLSEDW